MNFVRDQQRVRVNPECDRNHLRSNDFYNLSNLTKEYLQGVKDVPSTHLVERPKQVPFCPTLDQTSETMEYVLNEKEFRPYLHWGQLKLLLSEIGFLTMVHKHVAGDEAMKKLPIYCIYAGAAPGHHIKKLSEMFPSVNFVLYDPNEFVIEQSANITIFQDFFLDTDAIKWSSANNTDKLVFFVSDIRTFPATEQTVAENMEMQKLWIDIMQPVLSMVKFRLPWDTSTTEYLEGEIYRQAFSPLRSSETRLLIKQGAKSVTYSNGLYDQQCAAHNANRGNSHHHPDIEHVSLENSSLDKCYDCTNFVYTIFHYLDSMGKPTDSDSVMSLIKELETGIVFKTNLRDQTNFCHQKDLNRVFAKAYKQCSRGNCICLNVKKFGMDDVMDGVGGAGGASGGRFSKFNKSRMHSNLKLKNLASTGK